MKGLSDRDATIMLVLLVAVIVILPYTLYIKNARVETQQLKAECVTLEARYHQLEAMDAHRDEFIKRTKELNDEVDAIVSAFPADIRQENYLRFLLDTELSTAKLDPVTLDITWPDPEKSVWFDTVSFQGNDEVQIATDTIETPYLAVTNESAVTYQTEYAGLKYLLGWFIDKKQCGIPLCFPEFTAEYDEKTGLIKGAILIDQYAIKDTEDPDRVLAPVEIYPDLDKYHIRGNEDEGEINGIFGPVVHDMELSDEAKEMLENGGNALGGDNGEEPAEPAAE
ncbi:hypothetical protein SAMN02910370_00977 [Lachnospiraceae bacterium XPB1003]|nr:hypothetical protein SAMN02910370_00977 [Lachnospiraceae bacterium XPB1003]